MKTSSKTERIIYVAPSLSSFIKNDISILSDKYTVVLNNYSWSRKFLTPLYLIHQLLLLITNIKRTKIIIVSFGGYWAFLPSLIGKLFKVPVVIILNGTDCASIPSLNYGDLRKFPIRAFCNYSYRMATLLLPVSESLVTTRNIYHSDDEFSYQGYKHFFPQIKTEYQVIANGIDENYWKPIGEPKRDKKSFITVLTEGQFELKGGHLIIELAQVRKDCKFYFVGINRPRNTKLLCNVFYLGRLNSENLRSNLLNCQYYFQLSIFEGFGIALCEAMLCGCIPIGSSVNVIPEIIGDSGFILEKEKVADLADIVQIALGLENLNEWQEKARKRIIGNYSLKKRKEKLIALIEQFNNFII